MKSQTDRNKYKIVNSPIKWVGGKSRFRKQIVSLLPDHSCYVEPFSGAAWVLFAKPPSDVEVINDIDGELINFFRTVKYKPEEFIKSFELDLVSREEFERLAALDTKGMSDLERAHRFYYIIMAGWGGEHNYPRFQTAISDGGHGNRLIGAIKTLEKRIRPVHDRLKTVIIENLDWEICIDRYDREKTVMYIDPPYPGNKANYKFNMKSWEDHERISIRLSTTKCKWILSSFDIPEIRDLYSISDYSILPVESYSGMNKKKGSSERVKNKEVLIANFNIQKEVSREQLQAKFL